MTNLETIAHRLAETFDRADARDGNWYLDGLEAAGADDVYSKELTDIVDKFYSNEYAVLRDPETGEVAQLTRLAAEDCWTVKMYPDNRRFGEDIY